MWDVCCACGLCMQTCEAGMCEAGMCDAGTCDAGMCEACVMWGVFALCMWHVCAC